MGLGPNCQRNISRGGSQESPRGPHAATPRIIRLIRAHMVDIIEWIEII